MSPSEMTLEQHVKHVFTSSPQRDCLLRMAKAIEANATQVAVEELPTVGTEWPAFSSVIESER
jgi:hypothetical protein